MNNAKTPSVYRLDRRFVLSAIGGTLLLAAVALIGGMLIGRPVLLAICWFIALVLIGRAVYLWWRPPVVAELAVDQAIIGGSMTVKKVALEWLKVEQVVLTDGRLMFDRGTDTVVAFPLDLVGRRAPDFAREIYERLNAAYGYQRFELSAESGGRPD